MPRPTILAAWPRSGYQYTPPTPPPVIETPPPAPAHWLQHPDAIHGINQMHVKDGRLHLAHGAWFNGAHKAAYVDLATAEAVGTDTIPSEGFQTIREYGGNLYMPWQDPTGSWDAPQGYSVSSDNGVSWQSVRPFKAYHVFDFLAYGADLFMCGSGPDGHGTQRAVVWRSQDGGATWQESLTRYDTTTTPRFYALLDTGEGLYVSNNNIAEGGVFRFDGSEWATVAYSLDMSYWYGNHNVTAGGKVYSRAGTFDVNGPTPYAEDAAYLYPSWADATHVYALNPDTGYIVRTAIGEATWNDWLATGIIGRALGTTALLHDGRVYLGGASGRIWRYPAPA